VKLNIERLWSDDYLAGEKLGVELQRRGANQSSVPTPPFDVHQYHSDRACGILSSCTRTECWSQTLKALSAGE
jgi:hypothetical protein